MIVTLGVELAVSSTLRPVGVTADEWMLDGKVWLTGVYGSTSTSISASWSECDELAEEGGELVMTDTGDAPVVPSDKIETLA